MGGKTNRHPGPKPSRWTYSSRTAMEYVPGQRKHEWFTNVVDIQISSILPCHKTIWKKPPQQLTKVVYYLPRHVHILDATFWTFHGWGWPSLRYGCDPKEHDSIPWLKVFNVGHSSAWYQTTTSSAAHLVPSWSFPSDLADGWTSAATAHENHWKPFVAVNFHCYNYKVSKWDLEFNLF